jgi:pilus assembly protein CpaF
VKFRDNQQLMNICQRIVSQVGRRVDEVRPICDARLLDGSRVNVIAPPLAIDGPTLTIRKFKKDKLTLKQLSISARSRRRAQQVLEIIGKVRCNVVISGGTGSGKTTLLNCLTAFIERMSASSPAKTPPNCNCSSPMSCALKPARPTLKARAR